MQHSKLIFFSIIGIAAISLFFYFQNTNAISLGSFDFDFFKEGDASYNYDFILQSLVGKDTKCKIKTVQVTAHTGGTDIVSSQRFVGGSTTTGVTPTPLAFYTADTLKIISGYLLQVKGYCDNPSKGEIYVASSSTYSLDVSWTNPDGSRKAYTSQSITQGKNIKVSGSEVALASIYIPASQIEPFLIEYPSKYPVTINFNMFGKMKFFEVISGQTTKYYSVEFDGSPYAPVATWSRILVDKVRPPTSSEEEVAKASIEISSVTELQSNARVDDPSYTLDTYSGQKTVVVKGLVTQYKATQSSPTVSVYKCNTSSPTPSTQCTQVYIGIQSMDKLSEQTSATAEFRKSLKMPQNSPNGLYMIEMAMPGRIVKDYAYFNVLNVNTGTPKICPDNQVCPTSGGTLVPSIGARSTIYYENDFEDYSQNLAVNYNIQTGFIPDTSASTTQLIPQDILRLDDTYPKRDNLEKIKLNSQILLDKAEDFAKFKQVKSSNIKFTFTITAGTEKVTIEKPAFSDNAPIGVCQGNPSLCLANSKGKFGIHIASATISAEEIERQLQKTTQGDITISAVARGTFELITIDGKIYAGAVDGAKYEWKGTRVTGSAPPPGTDPESCQTTSSDVLCCPEGQILTPMDDTGTKFECRDENNNPVGKTDQQLCEEKGEDYTWDAQRNACIDNTPVPSTKTPQQFCEEKGGDWNTATQECISFSGDDPQKCPAGTEERAVSGGGYTCIDPTTNKNLKCGENILSNGNKVYVDCPPPECEVNKDSCIKGNPEEPTGGGDGKGGLEDCEPYFGVIPCVNAVQEKVDALPDPPQDTNYQLIAIAIGIGILLIIIAAIIKKYKSGV